MIEIKNISKSFNDKQVLFNISGKFIKGRTNLIIGASGTGKSVLLKCMVGLLSPDTGKVLFDGIEVSNLQPLQMYSRSADRIEAATRVATGQHLNIQA